MSKAHIKKLTKTALFAQIAKIEEEIDNCRVTQKWGQKKVWELEKEKEEIDFELNQIKGLIANLERTEERLELCLEDYEWEDEDE